MSLKRRDFITLLGGAAAAWPVAARAQQAGMPVVGFLTADTREGFALFVAAFRQGLQDTGFVEGRNLAIEYRFAENQFDRLPALATDLIQRRVAVIATDARTAAVAKSLTTSIPVVFMSGGDPVRNGLVGRLDRPGSNLTGVSILSSELTAKRFGLFRDLVPQARIMGVIQDSTAPSREFTGREVETAAQVQGVPIRMIGAGNDDEIETALATFAREGVGAVYATNGFFLFSHADRLAASALRHRLPVSAEQRNFVEAGGLMTYGPSLKDAFRQVGVYTGRILKGEKPGDLPVQLPTKFELVINLKTAKTIGLTVPGDILSIADEVIE
jgi:putative ABC transport system substrate-binding protein